MQFRRLFADDDAVSPVIGVILMVAITVILAAVIASFVLGLGTSTASLAPNTDFQFDYSGESPSTLEISVTGGDRVSAAQLNITGEFDGLEAGESGGDFSGSDGTLRWDLAGSSDTGGLGAGDSLELATAGGNADAYDLRVVWTAENGDQSSTLARSSGPDA
ncbi:MAG: type IV pilin N-terminal domain-containing protein [Halovenus sp.]